LAVAAKLVTGEAAAHFAAGDEHAAAGRHFLAAREYRTAIDLGRDGSDVRCKLSLALYGLGLVDEALAEIDRARELAPGAGDLHLPAGILRLAHGDLEPARQHLAAALRINPGSADAYYYLGEVYYRQGDYPRAWLCSRMALTLGHPGDGLRRKLAAVIPDADMIPWREDRSALHLRVIRTATCEQAQSVLARLAAGERFDEIAVTQGNDADQGFGGYAGNVAPADLEPAVAAELLDLPLFAPPIKLEVGGSCQVVQRIAPYDPAYWDWLLPATAAEPPSLASLPSAATAGPAVLQPPDPLPEPPAAAGQKVPLPATDAADPPEASPTAPTLAPAAVVPLPYRLHAGSHDTEASAGEQVEVLKQLGFPSFQFSLETAGGSYHVIAGKYATREEAEVGAARLKALGIKHYITWKP
jgi:hypothetical protein